MNEVNITIYSPKVVYLPNYVPHACMHDVAAGGAARGNHIIVYLIYAHMRLYARARARASRSHNAQITDSRAYTREYKTTLAVLHSSLQSDNREWSTETQSIVLVMAVRVQTLAAYSAVFILGLLISPPTVRAQLCTNSEPTTQGACLNTSSLHTDFDCGYLYHGTFLPNNITVNLNQALTVLMSYLPPYRGNCSHYFRAHLCLSALPVCENTGAGTSRFRPPCKDLCMQVTSDCGSELDEFFDINCLFNCDRWPDGNSPDSQCVSVNDPLVLKSLPSAPKPDPTPTPTMPARVPAATPLQENATQAASCPPESQTYFTDEAKRFAKGWVAFWSVLCFISTLVTLLTFCLDTSRFQYPWRPVVYLALSFHIHTLGYFLAFVIGPRSVICPGGSYVETRGRWTWAHTPCILVFGLLYYSMMAAFLWWLILTLSWFLSSAYKWSNEAISQFALFYHTAAWILPLILTVSVLAARVVSADELTGTCFIVRTDARTSFLALLLAVILPLAIFLLLGTMFLLIGFVNLLQIRRFMVHRGKEQESVILEKLMIRIGVYVAIYVLPAAVLIGCFIYEIDTRPQWHTVHDSCSHCSRPSTAVFMVRIFTFLLIGALTGVWIWSRKTLQSWKMLPVKLRNCVFPETERTQDTTGPKSATRLSSFTKPSSRQRPAPAASYPYTVNSGTEFNA